MAYRWRYLDVAGETTDGPDEGFDTRQEAEDWFGATWQELRDDGVDAVTLLDGPVEVYGPMSLHEA